MTIYLFDGALTPIKEIQTGDLIHSQQKQALKGLITHELETKYIPALDACVYFGMADPLYPETFWLYRVTERKKTGHTASLSGIYKFFDDLKGHGYMKDLRPKGASLETVLPLILEGTGWKMGTNSVQKAASTNFYYCSRLEGFWKAVETWNFEYRFTIRMQKNKIVEQRIDVAPQFAEDHKRYYEHGDRLLTVEAQRQEETRANAFLGRGKGELKTDENGEETGGYGRKILFSEVEWKKEKGDPIDKPKGEPFFVLEDETRENSYPDGEPRLQIVEFPDIEDPEELLRATYTHALQAMRPQVQYAADVLEERPVSLGEFVYIRRADIGINYRTRVFEWERNFLQPRIQKIRFGESLQVSRGVQQAQAKREEEKKEERLLSYMEELANSLTVDFLSEDGFNYDLPANNPYGLPAGLYSFDKPIDENPQKVIGMSAGKLVIANSKDSAGKWRFSTFGTGDGFTANLIRAGVLEGGKVRWNLETGEFNIADQLYYSPQTGLVIASLPDTERIEKMIIVTGEKLDALEGLIGDAVADVEYEYAINNDNENAPKGSVWKTDIPLWAPGKSIWKRTKIKKTDGTVEYTDPECLDSTSWQELWETSRAFSVEQTTLAETLIAEQEAAQKAYADGIVTELEREIQKAYRAEIERKTSNLNAKWEEKMAGAISVIEARLAEQESYLWVDGGNLYLGRKGQYTALTLRPEEIQFLVKQHRRGYFNPENLVVSNVRMERLEFFEEENPFTALTTQKPLFQWATRRVNGQPHLTLFYVGG